MLDKVIARNSHFRKDGGSKEIICMALWKKAEHREIDRYGCQISYKVIGEGGFKVCRK